MATFNGHSCDAEGQELIFSMFMKPSALGDKFYLRTTECKKSNKVFKNNVFFSSVSNPVASISHSCNT